MNETKRQKCGAKYGEKNSTPSIWEKTEWACVFLSCILFVRNADFYHCNFGASTREKKVGIVNIFSIFSPSLCLSSFVRSLLPKGNSISARYFVSSFSFSLICIRISLQRFEASGKIILSNEQTKCDTMCNFWIEEQSNEQTGKGRDR